MATFLVRAVVGGEDHEGILLDLKLPQQIQDPPGIAIDIADHGGKPLFGLGPIPVLELSQLRHFHSPGTRLVVGMRHIQRKKEEKRLLVVGPDEFLNLGSQEIRDVVYSLDCYPTASLWPARVLKGLPPRGDLVPEFLHLTISNEELGIEVVSMPHVHVAEKMIEPYVVGIAQLVRGSQPPLPDAGRPVARLLQERSHRGVPRTENNRLGRIPPHDSPPHVSTGHEDTSRGRANGAPGVELRKAHALRCHCIQSRRLQNLLSKATEVAVAKVIGQNEHDVRGAGLPGRPGLDRKGHRDSHGDKKKRAQWTHPFNPSGPPGNGKKKGSRSRLMRISPRMPGCSSNPSPHSRERGSGNVSPIRNPMY